MFFHLNLFSKERFKFESLQILTLALPMMIAQLAQVGTGFVDTWMSGQVSADDLAAVGLGSSIFATIYITLMGVPTALNPIFSQYFGANNKEELAETARQGLWLSLFLGIFAMVLMCLMVIPVKAYIHNMSQYTIDTLVLYLIGVSLGMPAAILQRALHSYAASLNRAKPIMWVSIFALILNIPFNYVLINGLYGFPKLGGAGCGFATALVFWVNVLVLGFYIYKDKYFRQFGLSDKFSVPSWTYCKTFLKIGIPVSLSFFLEVSAFSFVALLVANMGEKYVAAQQIVITVSYMIYIIPSSLGTSTSVRVGQSYGAGDRVRAYYISGIGLVVGFFGALLCSLVVILFREPVVAGFSNDATVVTVGVSILLYAAIFQIADATQTIASGALRGYKKTKVPMIIHAVSFWIFGLGLGSVLAFYYDMNIYGFWTALIVALYIAAIALTWYLAKVGLKEISRKKVWF